MMDFSGWITVSELYLQYQVSYILEVCVIDEVYTTYVCIQMFTRYSLAYRIKQKTNKLN